MNETKILYGKKKYTFWFVLFLVLSLSACTNSSLQDNAPEKVVQAYFEAWDEKEYEGMYALISDGFKKIEPTATSLEEFTTYAEAQQIESVAIDSIQQISNDGKEALVDYDIVFVIAGKEIPFSGSYTLKYRTNDDVPGWKLIHPYGENIDTS